MTPTSGLGFARQCIDRRCQRLETGAKVDERGGTRGGSAAPDGEWCTAGPAFERPLEGALIGEPGEERDVDE